MPHKLAAVFGVTAVVFFLQHPGVVWGQFQFLGGAVVGNPGCATADDGSGHVICAVQGTDHALYGIRFDPRTRFTTGFQFLGGAVVGNPSCASADDGSSQVTCAVQGTDHALYGIRFDPRTRFTTGFQRLGDTVVGNPSCASTGGDCDRKGQVICAVQRTDHALYGIRFDPWTRFTTGFQRLIQNVDLGPQGEPSCATADDGRGQVLCGIRGLGDQPSSFMIESIPSTRTQRPDGFQVLGGAIIDDPGCATADDGSGHVICAFKNEDNRLFAFRFYTPTLFTTAVQVLGGFAVGNPSCASTGDGSGQATCAVQGRDHALYGIRFEPWDRFTTGFQRLGGIVTSDPSCATADDERGQVICAVRGADNALYGIAIRP